MQVVDEGELVYSFEGQLASDGTGWAELPQGLYFRLGRPYELRLAVNPGGRYEVTSDTVPLPLDQQLIRDYTRGFSVSRQVDIINGTACEAPSGYAFQLNAASDVELRAVEILGQETDGSKLYGDRCRVTRTLTTLGDVYFDDPIGLNSRFP